MWGCNQRVSNSWHVALHLHQRRATCVELKIGLGGLLRYSPTPVLGPANACLWCPALTRPWLYLSVDKCKDNLNGVDCMTPWLSILPLSSAMHRTSLRCIEGISPVMVCCYWYEAIEYYIVFDRVWESPEVVESLWISLRKMLRASTSHTRWHVTCIYHSISRHRLHIQTRTDSQLPHS